MTQYAFKAVPTDTKYAFRKVPGTGTEWNTGDLQDFLAVHTSDLEEIAAPSGGGFTHAEVVITDALPVGVILGSFTCKFFHALLMTQNDDNPYADWITFGWKKGDGSTWDSASIYLPDVGLAEWYPWMGISHGSITYAPDAFYPLASAYSGPLHYADQPVYPPEIRFSKPFKRGQPGTALAVIDYIE